MSEYEPGTVALIEVGCHANRHVGLFTDRAWRYGDDKWVSDDPAIVTARPLVVIDPEDREQVERLWRIWTSLAPDHRLAQDNMQAALREYAKTKPAEPEGLGAVVEDADGRQYLRTFGDPGYYVWRRGENFDVQRFKYSEIDAVKVLSEGVTA